MDGTFIHRNADKTDETDATVVYADASHSPACRRVYGYGVCLVRRERTDFLGGLGLLPELFGDNHLAELFAAIHGLHAGIAVADEGSILRLFSDSVNALCVVAGHVPVTVAGDGNVGHGYWKSDRFNLRLSPVRTLNRQAIDGLDDARRLARERRVAIHIEHIKSHTGRKGERYEHHEECDRIAKCARWNAQQLFQRGRLK